MKYEVYRQIEVDKQILDILVATTFDEYTAKELVKNLRKTQNNQLAFYKKVGE